MGKKAVEMGKYGASELLRNKNVQKKAVNYGISKLTPFIQDSVGSAMNRLSTKVRPKLKYKTNRKDLDGTIHGGARYVRKPTLQDKIAEGAAMFVNPTASWSGAFKLLGSQALKGVTDNVKHYRGRGLDIHKQILKVAPPSGFTLPGHNYTGPGNPLEKQLRHDSEGNILEIYQQPTGPTDAVSMQHDVDYTVCGNLPKGQQLTCKNTADKKMVKSLDAIPKNERQWGHWLARTAINTKQKLGLGLNM